MEIRAMLQYAFANNCEVSFSQEVNQLKITVVMFCNTKRKKVMTQYLPMSDHTNPEKVKDCVDFIVETLNGEYLVRNANQKNFKSNNQ